MNYLFFFLQISAVKKALIDTEYQKELDESGKLQKYLARKRKKIAAHEKRKNTWIAKDL